MIPGRSFARYNGDTITTSVHFEKMLIRASDDDLARVERRKHFDRLPLMTLQLSITG